MDSTITGLFEKMKSKNFFWCYSGELALDEIASDIFVETVLKYGDVEDIQVLFNCYEATYLREVWIKRLVFDERFKKLNFYLAKIFFDTDLERLKQERKSDDRGNKLRMLASRNTAGIDKTFGGS
ncbi:MAG TPA: hypothetical protein VKO20_05155 [Desulfosalsimonadaceae bacterium]|nr:hypothetical protein [Desulfosalsimonadaceae bacterium]